MFIIFASRWIFYERDDTQRLVQKVVFQSWAFLMWYWLDGQDVRILYLVKIFGDDCGKCVVLVVRSAMQCS